MAETIFVVRSENETRLLLAPLEAAGYRVRQFTDSASALAEAANRPPALFILDMVLSPAPDGLSLCRHIRRQRTLASCRVMFVTVKSGEADRVLALETGADEYITIPFSSREFVARVKAVLRRHTEPGYPVLKIGALEINAAAMTATLRGKPIEVTTTEFRLLEMLATSAGRVVSRDHLLEQIWAGREVHPHAVDVYINHLRKKLEQDSAHPKYLHTIRGVGYRLSER